MKFELKPAWQRLTDEELLADLRRVADAIGSTLITKAAYAKHGRHDRGTFTKRFGSWSAALQKAGLVSQTPATREDLIADLQRVARELGRNYISFIEYRQRGRWSERPYVRVFGDWRTALDAAGLQRHPNLHERLSEEALFENLERVWVTLGRQPAYRELEKPLSSYSVSTYLNRFGSWRQALEAFVAWVNDETPESQPEQPAVDDAETQQRSSNVIDAPAVVLRVRRTHRAVNLRLRFRVMQRDNFTCRFCGRSPALVPGLVLHVDHIVPWEKGGESELENLQTLCEPCNLGKSNLV